MPARGYEFYHEMTKSVCSLEACHVTVDNFKKNFSYIELFNDFLFFSTDICQY